MIFKQWLAAPNQILTNSLFSIFLYPKLTRCNLLVRSCDGVENLLNKVFTESNSSFNLKINVYSPVKNVCGICMILRIPLKCDLFPKLRCTIKLHNGDKSYYLCGKDSILNII
jgi:hypothetical protein